MLNESGEGGHPCLVADLTGKDQLFTTEYSISCGFVVYDFYNVQVHFLYIHSIGSFLIITVCWILSSAISAFIEVNIWFLSSILLYHVDWYVDDEPSFQPWSKSHLIMVDDPFNVWLG